LTEESRPGADAAISRHRWPWPVPARRAVTVGLTAAALALCAAAGTTIGFAATDSSSPAAATGPQWYAGCDAACAAQEAAPPSPPVAPPTRVRVTRVGIDSALVRLRLDRAGVLEAPTDYAKAGWFEQGTAPGQPGPAVIAGHVDNKKGPAVFYKLGDLRVGDLIEVQSGGEWIPFRMVAREQYPKNHFPTASVYGPTPGPELRLITCGGSFDHSKGSYRDNIVVYAVDARAPVLPQSKGQGPAGGWPGS
jgi:hypothetical protein